MPPSRAIAAPCRAGTQRPGGVRGVPGGVSDCASLAHLRRTQRPQSPCFLTRGVKEAIRQVCLRAPFSSARLAPRPDGPLTHFASPRGEKCSLRRFHGVAMQRIPGTSTRDTAPGRSEPTRFGLTQLLDGGQPGLLQTDAHPLAGTGQLLDIRIEKAARQLAWRSPRETVRLVELGGDTSRNAGPGEVLRVPGQDHLRRGWNRQDSGSGSWRLRRENATRLRSRCRRGGRFRSLGAEGEVPGGSI